MGDNGQFQERMERLEGQLLEVERMADPQDRELTGQIIQNLMAFYGAGLAAIVRRLEQGGAAGTAILDQLAGDELVAGLFVLHELHPRDLETRVKAALEEVRPYLASHGGNIELLGIEGEGVVKLAMQGSCHGCPASAVTMKNSVETAIRRHAPEVSAIEVAGQEGAVATGGDAPAGFVSVEQLVANVARHQVGMGA